MGKLYSNVDKIYVKGHGYRAVEIRGSGYGNLLENNRKAMGKYLRQGSMKVWSDLKPKLAETKEKLDAELEQVIDEAPKKISKKAQKMLSQLVKSSKKKLSKKGSKVLASLL